MVRLLPSSMVILPIIASILILGALGFLESEAASSAEILLYEDPMVGFTAAVGEANQKIVADDFTLSSPANITNVQFFIFDAAFNDVVSFKIYKNFPGIPKKEIASSTGMINMEPVPVSTLCGSGCFEISVDLSSPILLDAGTYWIGISGTSWWYVMLDQTPAGLAAQSMPIGKKAWTPIADGSESFGIPMKITGVESDKGSNDEGNGGNSNKGGKGKSKK